MQLPVLVGYLDFILGAGLVASLVLVKWVWRVVAPGIYREFGLHRSSQSVACPERIEEILVRGDQVAEISTKWLSLFTREPKKGDLVQYYSQTQAITDPLPVKIRGLKTVEVKKMSDRVIAHFMAPTKPVTPWQVFRWSTKIETDPVYGPDSFFSVLDVDRPTGQMTVGLRSERPLGEVYIRRLPLLPAAAFLPTAKLDDKLLFELFLRASPRSFLPHEKGSGPHSVTWLIENPRLWSRFIIFAVYEGCSEKSEEWRASRKLTLIEALYLAVVRSLG